MRVELSNGHYAVIRDNMMRGDRRAAQKNVHINILADGTRVLPMGTAEDVLGALLYRMIVEWDVGQPVPSHAQTEELAQGILDTLDDRDMDRLRDAARPFLNRVMGVEGDPRSLALDRLAGEYPERFEELLAQARGEAENGTGDPKRVLTITATSTSAGPEPDGQPTPSGS